MAGKILVLTMMKIFILFVVLTVVSLAITKPTYDGSIFHNARYCNSIMAAPTTRKQLQMTIDSQESKNFKFLTLAILILLSGDVNPNPGPVKYPCSVCEKPVAKNHRALQCDQCDSWVHIKCDNPPMTPKEYEKFMTITHLTWECPSCRLPNLSDSFFMDRSNINLANSFSALSDSNESLASDSDSSQQSFTKRPGTIRFMTMNCQSLRRANRWTTLNAHINTYLPIHLTETQLDSNIASSEILQGGSDYDICRKDRNSHGGGVMIMTHKKYVTTNETGYDSDCEIIWNKIAMSGCKPLYTAAYYRPPNGDQYALEQLEESLQKIPQQRHSPNILLSGDFNMPALNWGEENYSVDNQPEYGAGLNNKMLEIVDDYNLSQCVKEPTREHNILDLVLTTNPDLVRNVQVVDGMSDHKAVICDIDMKAKINRKKPRKIFLYKDADMDTLKQQLRTSYDSFKNVQHTREVEENWKDFKNILQSVMRENIPQKTLSGRNHIPWMTYSIRRKIRQKQRLYNKAKRSREEKDWKAFRDARRTIKHLLEKAHTDYVMNLLSMPDSNKQHTSITKKFWRYIKSQKRDSCGISPLTEDGRTHEDNKGKAEVLSRQFQSVFTKEDNTYIPQMTDTQRLPPIGSLTISTAGVEKLLGGIDLKKASGPDEIPCRIMKDASAEIAPFLRDIYQQSLITGKVPEDWRSANITCLFKKGDRSVPANYRPVSLTSVPCKLLEHIIFHHIISHLELHDFFVDYQHGFRRQRSCETQLIVTLEDISRSLNNKHQVDMLILDFSKAFDTVAHRRLLTKLEHYGIRGEVLHWLESWLTTRHQRVVVDGENSEEVAVSSGVPQGTVLGPLMFLIYVNDIGNEVRSNLRLFADDALLYKEVTSEDDARQLQSDLTRLEQWSKQWQMSFNPKKCIVQRVHKSRNPIIRDYQLLGHTLDTSQHSTFLGVQISSDLSWDQHITNIAAKANRSLGFVRRNLQRCPEKVKEQAYVALVRPHLEYACCAWDPYLKKHINLLEMVQRRSARFVKSNHSREEGTVTALYRDLQWKTLQQRRQTFRLIMMYKIINGLVAVKIPPYITKPTRDTRNFHPLRYRQVSTRINQYQHSFLPRTIRDWNALPDELLECPSLEAFRRNINA
jgi:hypothetical protein